MMQAFRLLWGALLKAGVGGIYLFTLPYICICVVFGFLPHLPSTSLSLFKHDMDFACKKTLCRSGACQATISVVKTGMDEVTCRVLMFKFRNMKRVALIGGFDECCRKAEPHTCWVGGKEVL